MNFQQLRIVRETVRRHFNLTEVANALYTSQSGVSKHIKDLEDELGVALFIRKGTRLLGLTEPGKEMVRIVDRMLLDAANLKRVAPAFGLDPSRLVFAPRIPPDEHLARHKLADLFLDTLPYNAHTTASDALWAGLPVLTCIGQTFASRVAASLLTSIELPELITSSTADYEAMAIALAIYPDQLQAIKRKLADHRLTTRLFDCQAFTRNLEATYTAMVQRHQADLPPDHIYVQLPPA